ncbi:hypothetical protein NEOKW01_2127 [Nematocida sp. AWRm80]|nr:hypothetical protein NEOKW01_2127 [Nematocida sp. AWRm80]
MITTFLDGLINLDAVERAISEKTNMSIGFNLSDHSPKHYFNLEVLETASPEEAFFVEYLIKHWGAIIDSFFEKHKTILKELEIMISTGTRPLKQEHKDGKKRKKGWKTWLNKGRPSKSEIDAQVKKMTESFLIEIKLFGDVFSMAYKGIAEINASIATTSRDAVQPVSTSSQASQQESSHEEVPSTDIDHSATSNSADKGLAAGPTEQEKETALKAFLEFDYVASMETAGFVFTHYVLKARLKEILNNRFQCWSKQIDEIKKIQPYSLKDVYASPELAEYYSILDYVETLFSRIESFQFKQSSIHKYSPANHYLDCPPSTSAAFTEEQRLPANSVSSYATVSEGESSDCESLTNEDLLQSDRPEHQIFKDVNMLMYIIDNWTAISEIEAYEYRPLENSIPLLHLVPDLGYSILSTEQNQSLDRVKEVFQQLVSRLHIYSDPETKSYQNRAYLNIYAQSKAYNDLFDSDPNTSQMLRKRFQDVLKCLDSILDNPYYAQKNIFSNPVVTHISMIEGSADTETIPVARGSLSNNEDELASHKSSLYFEYDPFTIYNDKPLYKGNLLRMSPAKRTRRRRMRLFMLFALAMFIIMSFWFWRDPSTSLNHIPLTDGVLGINTPTPLH